MQPPLITAHLKNRISLLKQQMETNTRKEVEKASRSTKSSPSMETLIEDWVKGLTPDQKSRTYGISEIIQLCALKGRYKELPAKQMVATALYKCGFSQTRSYKNGFRNRRLWRIG